MSNHRRHIKKGKRSRVFKRDGYQCVKCRSSADLTVDHIVPWSKGGLSGMGNLQTLCRQCNADKGNGLPTDTLTGLFSGAAVFTPTTPQNRSKQR